MEKIISDIGIISEKEKNSESFVKSRDACNSLATAIHKSGWNEQADIVAMKMYATGKAKKFGFFLQHYTLLAGKLLNEQGPGIVAGIFIFAAGVSQSNN